MSVLRNKPLPRGDLKGEFYVNQSVVTATIRALRRFADAGDEGLGHEGIVFWAGREVKTSTFFLATVIPNASHSPQKVSVSARNVGRAAKAARKEDLGLLAQVHSHPGADTRHSDGDDDLVLLPFEGMLSLVAPNYGYGADGLEDFTVHQFQDGVWVEGKSDSVNKKIHCMRERIDLTEGDGP